MNNSVKRITRGVAYSLYESICAAIEDPSTAKEILRGGGSAGGVLTKNLMPRQIENIRISADAFKLCRERKVNILDFFLLGRDSKKLKKRYGNFFSSNMKEVEKCHAVGHYVTFDHNIPNKAMIDEIFKIVEKYYKENAFWDIAISQKEKEYIVKKIITILNKQSIDMITIEENKKLDIELKSTGTKEQRDALCSPKTELKDIWLTPQHIIDQFFETSGLDKDKCLDPCASDGRWLSGKGISRDILPMSNSVKEEDFLEMKTLPEGIEHIIGNIPFSLTKEFVEKSFELTGEAFFLVNGDTIMNHYNGHIKKLWIINGIEGDQKDYRSRCEFETIILKKSALWCCIVQLTKEKQEKFVIEKDISNPEKRDGFHVALGRNIFIKSPVLVDKNERIIRLKTIGTIRYR